MNNVHLQEIDQNVPIQFGIASNILDINSLNESDMKFQADISRIFEKYNDELDESLYDDIDPEEELNFNH
jgi:hypothetical protein